MTKTAIRFGAVLKCDASPLTQKTSTVLARVTCTQQFVSYSCASWVRKQAALAGWTRPSALRALDAAGAALTVGWSDQKVDLCPDYKAAPWVKKKKEPKPAAKDAAAKKPKRTRKPKAP